MTMNKNKVLRKLPQLILVLILMLLCAIMLLPFFWMFSTSLRLPKDSFKMPPSFFPTSFKIENYVEVFRSFPFLRFILNSLFVAVLVVAGNIVVTTMAAFAFSRLNFKFRDGIFLFFLAGMMIPSQATLIPQFIIMSKLRLVGELWSLIFPAITTPLSIFLVRQYMMTIPKSYEEAAYIDGAGRFKIYSCIILPMSVPVIVMTGLQTFLGSWNNYMGALIYLSDWEKMTLPVGLKILQNARGAGNASEVLAGVAISIVPPLILYLFGQKHLIRSASLSGLKS